MYYKIHKVSLISIFLIALIFVPFNAISFQDPTNNKRLILSEIDETFFCVEKKEIEMNTINRLEKKQVEGGYSPGYRYRSKLFKLKINTLKNKLSIINTIDTTYDVKTKTIKKTKPIIVETIGLITSFDKYNLNAVLDYSFVGKEDGKEFTWGWFGKPSNQIQVMSFNIEDLSYVITRQIYSKDGNTDVITLIGECQRS